MNQTAVLYNALQRKIISTDYFYFYHEYPRKTKNS